MNDTIESHHVIEAPTAHNNKYSKRLKDTLYRDRTYRHQRLQSKFMTSSHWSVSVLPRPFGQKIGQLADKGPKSARSVWHGLPINSNISDSLLTKKNAGDRVHNKYSETPIQRMVTELE